MSHLDFILGLLALSFVLADSTATHRFRVVESKPMGLDPEAVDSSRIFESWKT